MPPRSRHTANVTARGRLPGRIATNLLTRTSIPPLPNVMVEDGSNRWIYRSYTCSAETPSSWKEVGVAWRFLSLTPLHYAKMSPGGIGTMH